MKYFSQQARMVEFDGFVYQKGMKNQYRFIRSIIAMPLHQHLFRIYIAAIGRVRYLCGEMIIDANSVAPISNDKCHRRFAGGPQKQALCIFPPHIITPQFHEHREFEPR